MSDSLRLWRWLCRLLMAGSPALLVRPLPLEAQTLAENMQAVSGISSLSTICLLYSEGEISQKAARFYSAFTVDDLQNSSRLEGHNVQAITAILRRAVRSWDVASPAPICREIWPKELL